MTTGGSQRRGEEGKRKKKEEGKEEEGGKRGNRGTEEEGGLGEEEEEEEGKKKKKRRTRTRRSNFICIYRPPLSNKNNFIDSMFFDQFSDFLEHSYSLPGKTLLTGDFNFHFENVDNNSRRLHDIIDTFKLTQSATDSTYNQGYLLDLVFF